MTTRWTQQPGRLWLRRDFADEMLYGDYLMSIPYGEIYAPIRRLRNRALGLSPALPQYLLYDLSEPGKLRITLDDGSRSVTRFTPFIEGMLRMIERSVGWSKECGRPHPLAAKPDGRAQVVFLHCSHTGCGWVVPFGRPLAQFVATTE